MSHLNSNIRNFLVVGFLIVRKIYSAPESIQIFEDIASRRRSVQLGARLFEICRFPGIQAMLVLLFGYFSALRYTFGDFDPDEFIALAIYPNEVKTIRRFQEIQHNIKHVNTIRNFKNLTHIVRILKVIPVLAIIVPKAHKALRSICRKYHFLVACQCSNYIFCYASFAKQLKIKPAKGVITSSLSLPETIAIQAAARRKLIPSILAAHSCIGPQGISANLLPDLFLLDGQASYDALLKHSPSKSYKSIFWGIPGKISKMNVPEKVEEIKRIGIFLTSPVNLPGLLNLMSRLTQAIPAATLIVRPHPILMLTPNLESIYKNFPDAEIDFDSLLDTTLQKCSIIISGDSNVHREVLHSGIPSIYVSSIDTIAYDNWGFVRDKIVWEWELSENLNLLALKEFYDECWSRRFVYYDASYNESPEVTKTRVRIEFAQMMTSFSK